MGVIICNGTTAGLMVTLNVVGPTTWGVGKQESVVVIAGVNVPVPVGVPLSSPPAVSVKPAGMLVPDHEIGEIPPVLVNWNE